MYINNRAQSSEEYNNARKSGKKDFYARTSHGRNGYLVALEEMIKNADIVSEVTLGVVEIPLQKIIGTYTTSRSTTFARNFMPLLPSNSEFGIKWINLYSYQQREGITDPIKCYEYLNWFYVIEGNKRVSVLKYLDSYSIYGEVIRLVPKNDHIDPTVDIYYEFLEFYKETKINSIWFTHKGRFTKFLDYIKNYYSDVDDKEKFKSLVNQVYLPFRKSYFDNGGKKFAISTGDAFFKYIKNFGIPDISNMNLLKSNLQKLMLEYEVESNIYKLREEKIAEMKENKLDEILIRELNSSNMNIPLKTAKKQKIAFIYRDSIEKSIWSYIHEIGRQSLKEKFDDVVDTFYIQNVSGEEEISIVFDKVATQGYDAIFSTSFEFMDVCVDTAIKYPNIKFFQCEGYITGKNLYSYWSKMYEPRFLTGLIAGAMTKTNKIGFIGSKRIPQTLNELNAFGIGINTVNNSAAIKTIWTGSFFDPKCQRNAALKLIESGVDVIAYHGDSDIILQVCEEHGVYCIGYGADLRIRAPHSYLTGCIYDWGKYYSEIIYDIYGGTLKLIFDVLTGTQIPEIYYAGMEKGVTDISYISERVPYHTKMLIKTMRDLIIEKEISVFTGPIFDNKGNLIVSEEKVIPDSELIATDWVFKNILEEWWTEIND